MFKTTKTYHVGPTDYLDKVFTDKILPNGFINKGRCSIGGTNMEIHNLTRCAIITVPNISIVKSKKEQHPELYEVYGDITSQEVYGYLMEKKPGQKIISTPEGLEKIMLAAKEHNRLEEFYNEWFLMLDEAHSFITEHYREGILTPFKYFWKFNNKCIISATPYYFTDPRMAELDYHHVKLTGKIGQVTLVNSLSVSATLDYLLKHIDEFPGNVHIFFNSVTEIVKAIQRAGIRDCNIYCADDERNHNMNTLGEFVKFYVAQPNETNFKKINFYTCKCFEGWDMYDTNATMVLVTDVHRAHTKIGIADKGVQAFGRLRGKKGTNEPAKPFQLLHITNHLYNNHMKDHNSIISDFTRDAKFLIGSNNDYWNTNKMGTMSKDTRLERCADINETTHIATINTMKLDQFINEASKAEVYNNIKYIKKAWECLYKVEQDHSTLKIEGQTVIKRKSVRKQFKEDYESLLAYKQKSGESNLKWNLGASIVDQIAKTNPLAYNAFKILDESTVLKCNYTPSKIRVELILKQNENAEVKLLRLLDHHFKVGRFYENEFITNLLQKLYDKLEIRNKNGSFKVASPSQLAELGRFEIVKDKKQNARGKWVHGYKIQRKQFSLMIAA